MRSLLFAPGNQPDVLAKMPRCRPGGAVIDLEDATPPDHKAEARRTAVGLTSSLSAQCPLYVRVNGLDSDWFADDVAGALAPGLSGVVVPKLTSAGEVDRVADALDAAGFADLAVVAGLETVAGVVNAVEVAAHPRVAVCYFGAEDYVADLGGARRADNLEVLVARSQVAQAARLGGAAAIDMVVADFGDDQRFERESVEARALGYVGKLCIHPAQVALADRTFRPTDEELAWAGRVVEAFDAALATGEAAIQVDGGMVDEPVVRRARALLAQAD